MYRNGQGEIWSVLGMVQSEKKMEGCENSSGSLWFEGLEKKKKKKKDETLYQRKPFSMNQEEEQTLVIHEAEV